MLFVDDFGVKYFSKDNVMHLIDSLKKHCTIREDWTGTNYCGFKIDSHCDKDYVDISSKIWQNITIKNPKNRNILRLDTIIQYIGNKVKY